jgi:hypothetical protein
VPEIQGGTQLLWSNRSDFSEECHYQDAVALEAAWLWGWTAVVEQLEVLK